MEGGLHVTWASSIFCDDESNFLLEVTGNLGMVRTKGFTVQIPSRTWKKDPRPELSKERKFCWNERDSVAHSGYLAGTLAVARGAFSLLTSLNTMPISNLEQGIKPKDQNKRRGGAKWRSGGARSLHLCSARINNPTNLTLGDDKYC